MLISSLMSRLTICPFIKNSKAWLSTQSKGKLPIPGVNKIYLVSSAKGGVVNLAVALTQTKPSVNIGLLDADIFGPSIPKMLNLEGLKPEADHRKVIKPLKNYGIKTMSIGFITDVSSAIVWRGLMVMSAIKQMIRQVEWGPLDILVVDMPPGTGDVQLSLAQNVPISGSIAVTTPQKISLLDTRRGLHMFETLKIPVVGVVENMSYIECDKCNNKINMFVGHNHDKSTCSDSAGEILSVEFGVPLLERFPFDPSIVHGSDNGIPVTISNPNCNISRKFKALAKTVHEFVQ